MYLVAFQVRAKSSQAVQDICRTFRQTLALVQSPGFLHGTCTTVVGDPCVVVIYETWGTLEAFEAWIKSEGRRHLLEQITPLMDGPLRTQVFQEV